MLAIGPRPAHAGDPRLYPGPFLAEVVRVIDGDTVEVRAHIWPDQVVTTAVRLADIDTPELRGRCAAEKAAAERARDHVKALVIQADGALWLRNVRLGTYAGRVLGELETETGLNLGRALIEAGHAVPYADRKAQRTRLCGGGG
ncbi:thermonuclease family protein [Roseospira navarrensis]|uniref:Thermonuclease family protein n=1 Tax=Roseospira navarrensis TaxID=140058 RepID=A0A7X2D3S0_9PROT|nr:thermonuclease family protein [Roseospira navarrensis]MQX37118.1 thermonuclease family protein [Roseospira navarrensis]